MTFKNQLMCSWKLLIENSIRLPMESLNWLTKKGAILLSFERRASSTIQTRSCLNPSNILKEKPYQSTINPKDWRNWTSRNPDCTLETINLTFQFQISSIWWKNILLLLCLCFRYFAQFYGCLMNIGIILSLRLLCWCLRKELLCSNDWRICKDWELWESNLSKSTCFEKENGSKLSQRNFYLETSFILPQRRLLKRIRR